MNKSAYRFTAQSHPTEAGFSVFKMLFWLALLGFVTLNGALIAQAYYNNSKAQGCFESLSQKMPAADEAAILAKMDTIFHVQYIDKQDFPPAFYDELVINATGFGVEISTVYDVTIWPLGQVEALDEVGAYDPDNLEGLDVLKHKFRIDLSFNPYAISAVGDQ
ncbi:MAG: hypothetical protein Q9M17_09995 [Mariprofundus sp.]|nr:hypothetical protein [Mariprofundus sp.]